MKHLKTMILILLLAAGSAFAQDYYDDEYAEVPGNYDESYLAYDYGYAAAQPWLSHHYGPVYYWTHPYREVYFVLVGPRIFVIPIHELNHIWHRLRWSLVSMDRFIHLSCYGLPYYDSYVRFNYYYNHYRSYRYDRYRNHWLRDRYRRYFHNRRFDRDYYRYRGRVLQKRRLDTRDRYRPGSRLNRGTPGAERGTFRYTPGTRKPVANPRYQSRVPMRGSRSTTVYRSRTTTRNYTPERSSRVVRKSTRVRSTSPKNRSVTRSTRSSSTTRSVHRSRSSRSVSSRSTARSRRK
ncbi:MAG: hypothetical protein RB296_10445 [Acidobacteriota bacterium]|jgi:hypothetical protein|nr:hypothetical protein [Acidobacteriota bacterium]